MAAIRKSLGRLRWYHWTAFVIALLYLTYIALSYLYLPGKLKAIVQTDVSRTLGRQVTVQRIAFNPFTLSLTADGLSIADRPQRPLVSWRRLFVNFDAWGSLFGWKVRFSAVQLDAPHIAVERRKQGFNFSDIVQRLSGSKPAAAPARKKRPLALKVDDIRITEGRFRFDDVSGSHPAHSTMRNIGVHVQDLYLATGDRQLNPFHLQAAMPGGGMLRLTGQYRADPLRLQAQVDAQDVHLDAFSGFVEGRLPLKISDGRLTLKTGVTVSMTDSLQVRLQQGDVTISRLALDDAAASPPLLRCSAIRIQDIDMDMGQHRFSIGSVAVDGLNTHQWLDKSGRPRLAPLLAQGGNARAAKAPAAATPWAVSVAKTTVKDSRIAFTDRRNGLDATQKIHGLNVALGPIHLNSDKPVAVKVDAGLNDSATFGTDGHITLSPFAADLHYQLQKLALMPFNPYLKSLSWVALKQGRLSVVGRVQIKPAAHQPMLLALNAAVDGLNAVDSRTGKSVLKWKTLKIERLKLDTAKRNLAVDKIMLSAPEIAGKRGTDKKIDLATLMKPSPAGSKAGGASPAGKAPAPWQVAVHTLALDNGTIRFTDAGIRPVFKTGLYALDVKVDRLTSTGKHPAQFTLKAKVDRYAPFTIKGTLAPLQSQPGFAFTSRLQGLEMPPFSPYTGTYIGHKLKSGRLALNLKYKLRRKKLEGKNDITAKQLYLGDKVDSDKAVHLPVGLGLALLRDASGVIDLDVGVSGNIGDPSFSVSGIILKALKNIIIKAATSPFRLLASLVGGSKDMGNVEFPAGTDTLNPDNQDKLRQLAKALTKRPQLEVTVTGCAGVRADDSALQMQRVLQQIAARRKVAVSELKTEALLDNKANRKALRDLNARLKLPDEDKRKQALAAAQPDLKGDALTQRVYRNMLDEVASHQTVTQQDRMTLADQRALTIKQFLVGPAGVQHSRIHLQKATAEDLRGRTCHLGVQAH